MNRKYATLCLCIAALTAGVLAAGRPHTSSQHAPERALVPTLQHQQFGAVPEHVVYRMFLRQIFNNQQQADKAERRGDRRAAHAWRHHYEDAELSEEQMRALTRIATECEQEVREMDAKARAIIDARRALYYPGDKVPPGGKLAPPSPELIAMQQERDALILRCRERVREAFGEQEFARLQDFLRRRVVPDITLSPIPAPQPSTQIEPQPEPRR